MALSDFVTGITSAAQAASAAAINVNNAVTRIQGSPNPNQLNTIGSVVGQNTTLANTPLWEVASIGALLVIVALVAFILVKEA